MRFGFWKYVTDKSPTLCYIITTEIMCGRFACVWLFEIYFIWFVLILSKTTFHDQNCLTLSWFIWECVHWLIKILILLLYMCLLIIFSDTNEQVSLYNFVNKLLFIPPSLIPPVLIINSLDSLSIILIWNINNDIVKVERQSHIPLSKLDFSPSSSSDILSNFTAFLDESLHTLNLSLVVLGRKTWLETFP